MLLATTSPTMVKRPPIYRLPELSTTAALIGPLAPGTPGFMIVQLASLNAFGFGPVSARRLWAIPIARKHHNAGTKRRFRSCFRQDNRTVLIKGETGSTWPATPNRFWM